MLRGMEYDTEALRAELADLEAQIREAERRAEGESCTWVALGQREQAEAARRKLERLRAVFADELGDGEQAP